MIKESSETGATLMKTKSSGAGAGAMFMKRRAPEPELELCHFLRHLRSCGSKIAGFFCATIRRLHCLCKSRIHRR